MVVVCNWLVASYQLVGLFEQTSYFSIHLERQRGHVSCVWSHLDMQWA